MTGITLVVLFGLVAVFMIPYVDGQQKSATVGRNFHHAIMRETFFNPTPPNGVYFKASKVGKPGLPGWLAYTQKDPMKDTAFLYGTPTQDDVGQVSLEIVGFNVDTYETVSIIMTINILTNDAPSTYFATFNVTNKDVEDLYIPNNEGTLLVDEFLSTVKTVTWQNGEDLTAVKVMSSLNAGGRVPIPGLPAGVVIDVGSGTAFSSVIEENAKGLCNTSLRGFVDAGFNIDWCYFKIRETETGDSDDDESDEITIVLGSVYVAPVLTSEKRDLTTEFILIVVVPFVVAIVLALLLSYIMCARRQGVLKRDAVTPQVQLTHHDHIRQASKDIRDMSMRREGAQPLSTLPPFRLSPTPRGRGGRGSEPGTPPRDTDRPLDEQPLTSTPQGRSGAPPPYRLPPSFPAQEETSFINQPADDGNSERRASEPTGLQDDEGNGAMPALSHRPPPFMRGSGEQMHSSQPGSEERLGAGGSKHTIPDTVNEYEEQENDKESLVNKEYLT